MIFIYFLESFRIGKGSKMSFMQYNINQVLIVPVFKNNEDYYDLQYFEYFFSKLPLTTVDIQLSFAQEQIENLRERVFCTSLLSELEACQV